MVFRSTRVAVTAVTLRVLLTKLFPDPVTMLTSVPTKTFWWPASLRTSFEAVLPRSVLTGGFIETALSKTKLSAGSGVRWNPSPAKRVTFLLAAS